MSVQTVLSLLSKAIDPKTSPEILRKLAMNEVPEIRCAVAWNIATSSEVLEKELDVSLKAGSFNRGKRRFK